jgi:hypothetical protein
MLFAALLQAPGLTFPILHLSVWLLWASLALFGLLSILPGTPARRFLRALTGAGLLATALIYRAELAAVFYPCGDFWWVWVC